LDRGLSIDRYYIENFLQTYADDVHGRVLEIGDPGYTRRFGGNRVTQSDVLHATAGNSKAILVGDLATGEGIPLESYDCIILTQTLLCIFEVGSTIQHLYTALRPGGVVLGTVPGISQISRYDMDRWGDYWRFTDASVRKLFVPAFGAENVIVETYGNVATACAFLQGLAARDLRRKQLDYHDNDYQVVITFRAVKNQS
jgi:SAM-dependent methyltransferase